MNLFGGICKITQFDLFKQGNMLFFGQMSFFTFHNKPSDRNSPLLVSETNHQHQTLTPSMTGIHSQHQWPTSS